MTTYATFMVTFRVEDRELLMSKFRETDLYRHLMKEEVTTEQEIHSSVAILELLIMENPELLKAIGVEELSSSAHPDTVDENENACNMDTFLINM